jgi:hypothetical protein
LAYKSYLRNKDFDSYKSKLKGIALSLAYWLPIIESHMAHFRGTDKLQKLDSVLHGLYLPFSEAIKKCLGGEYNSCEKAGEMLQRI